MAGVQDAVWINVLPSMERFASELGKGADKAAEQQGGLTGKKFGLAMLGGVAAVAGGAVLAGKALYNLGSAFDEMQDTIRVGTGATGKALDGLVASAKVVSTQVPHEFGAVSQALADINTRTGLTGPTLEKFTSQVLEAGRITGNAIDVNQVTAAFSVFRIEGEKSTEAMDTLYRVSQDTGVGINELAGLVQKAGPAAQQLGFSFDQTAALIGKLDKAGLDAGKMVGGLSKSLSTMAKAGEEPEQAFQRITSEIKAYSDRGNDAAALDLAGKLFGTKNAPQFIQALQDGTLNLDNLTQAAVGSGDTILAASEETRDFGEQWQIFSNRMSVLVAPAAEYVFGLISSGMQWINDYAIPWVQQFFGSMASGGNTANTVAGFLGGLWNIIQNVGIPVVQGLARYFIEVLVPNFMKFYGIIRDHVIPVLMDIWNTISTHVLPIVRNVVDFLVQKVFPVVSDFANRVVAPAMRLIGGLFKWVWETVGKPVFEGLVGYFNNTLGPIFTWLWEKVISPTFKSIGDAISGFERNWKNIWSGIKRAAAAPVNFVIDVIWNKGLRKALNLIPGVDLAEAKTISGFARGGIIPGRSRYSDGDDRLIAVRGGEGILVSEALDDFEIKRLHALNKAALSGMSPRRWRERYDGHARGGIVRGTRHGIPGFAAGGLVTFQGKTFTPVFRDRLALAQRRFGRPFHISQGGFRPRTSYSGTSHAGDAVDITSPVARALIIALRSVGIAAWDRTGKGRWVPHIHGVPLPGHGRAGGSAVWQARDYLRGGDGLGGRDNGPRVTVNISPSATASALEALGGGQRFRGQAEETDIFQIPAMVDAVIKKLREAVDTPWMRLIRDGIHNTISGVKSWVWDQIKGLGYDIADAVVGPKYTASKGTVSGRLAKLGRGYAHGTGNAAPGAAWVGEFGHGFPELVEGPQRRHFSGGETVHSSAATRRLLAGGGDKHTHIGTVNVSVAAKDLDEVISFLESADLEHRVGSEG